MGKTFVEDERPCDSCVNVTRYGCVSWNCEYINRDEAIKAWREKHETADRKTEQTEPRLEQFRVGLEYHTDSVNFGKPKGESITTNKTEPQIEKCPFDDSLPCKWVCTEYGKCKYKPKTKPQTDCSWQNDEYIPTELASTMLKERFKEQK